MHLHRGRCCFCGRCFVCFSSCIFGICYCSSKYFVDLYNVSAESTFGVGAGARGLAHSSPAGSARSAQNGRSNGLGVRLGEAVGASSSVVKRRHGLTFTYRVGSPVRILHNLESHPSREHAAEIFFRDGAVGVFGVPGAQGAQTAGEIRAGFSSLDASRCRSQPSGDTAAARARVGRRESACTHLGLTGKGGQVWGWVRRREAGRAKMKSGFPQCLVISRAADGGLAPRDHAHVHVAE